MNEEKKRLCSLLDALCERIQNHIIDIEVSDNEIKFIKKEGFLKTGGFRYSYIILPMTDKFLKENGFEAKKEEKERLRELIISIINRIKDNVVDVKLGDNEVQFEVLNQTRGETPQRDFIKLPMTKEFLDRYSFDIDLLKS